MHDGPDRIVRALQRTASAALKAFAESPQRKADKEQMRLPLLDARR
jgi:hypothetical protein